jgi:hypothetical protein
MAKKRGQRTRMKKAPALTRETGAFVVFWHPLDATT